MNLIQTVLDNYIFYVFGSFWIATLFLLIVMVVVMSYMGVSNPNQTYVIIFALLLFANQYIGIKIVIAIILSYIVYKILQKKILST